MIFFMEMTAFRSSSASYLPEKPTASYEKSVEKLHECKIERKDRSKKTNFASSAQQIKKGKVSKFEPPSEEAVDAQNEISRIAKAAQRCFYKDKYEEAFDHLNNIVDDDIQFPILLDFISTLCDKGLFDLAIEKAKAIFNKADREEMLEKIADKLIYKGHSDKAFDLLRVIPDEDTQCSVLGKIINADNYQKYENLAKDIEGPIGESIRSQIEWLRPIVLDNGLKVNFSDFTDFSEF